MSDRFFLENEILDNTTFVDGDQAHHIVNVMRFKAGDTITLFDGKGGEHIAAIVEVSKKKILLNIESTKVTSDSTPQVSIAVALPKGDRQKFLLEKLVELNVSRMIPLKTKRSVAAANEKAIGRLNKSVVEASKQCGRNYLMEVMAEHSIGSLIEFASGLEQTSCWIADPNATDTLSMSKRDEAESAIIAIGPEGGFDCDEIAQLVEAGWKKVKLSSTILRIETAAVAAAVLLRSDKAN